MSAVAERKVVVPLASGFEEIEAVSIIDVLRRAGVSVVTAGIGGALRVNGSHDIPVEADVLFEELDPQQLPDAVVLPGGMPGSKYLAEHSGLRALLRRTASAGRLVAAVCAAPLALHAAGLLAGRRVTAYPTVRESLSGAVYTGERVEEDGNIITGLGPGAAAEFALRIAARLASAETAEELARRMVLPGSRAG